MRPDYERVRQILSERGWDPELAIEDPELGPGILTYSDGVGCPSPEEAKEILAAALVSRNGQP